jgi:hypothetical protein
MTAQLSALTASLFLKLPIQPVSIFRALIIDLSPAEIEARLPIQFRDTQMACSCYAIKTYPKAITAEFSSKVEGEAIVHVVTVNDPGLMFDLTATVKTAGEFRIV